MGHYLDIAFDVGEDADEVGSVREMFVGEDLQSDVNVDRSMDGCADTGANSRAASTGIATRDDAVDLRGTSDKIGGRSGRDGGSLGAEREKGRNKDQKVAEEHVYNR